MIADLQLRNPTLKFRITAHTCDLGTPEYNENLSVLRAKAVKTYLVKQGVPPPSIQFRGKGHTEPRADNKTEEGRRKNRRVEFSLVQREWDAVY